jgi:hypothetical protein
MLDSRWKGVIRKTITTAVIFRSTHAFRNQFISMGIISEFSFLPT